MQDILDKAAQIDLVIFDVDGVLTDGSLFYGDDGQEYKAFNSRDGHGIKMAQKHGLEFAIITGRSSKVVEHRVRNLGISHVYQGQRDKLPAFEALAAKLGILPGRIAYVGDDVVDLPVMTRVGFAVAVQDAHPFVKQHAHWITPHGGGRGAARDFCELWLEARGKLKEELESYL